MTPPIRRQLMLTLKRLTDDQLKEFHFLIEDQVLACQLSNKDRADTVTMLIQYYNEDGAVRATVDILKVIPRNDLVEELKKHFPKVLSGDKDSAENNSDTITPCPPASASASASPVPSAQTGGACGLTLDPNTAHRLLSLSEGNRKVTGVNEVQPYPDHPDRFGIWKQVLCGEGLTGRCSWEAEWDGDGVSIALTYGGIGRSGGGDDCKLGRNDKSWSLECYTDGCNSSYTARHAEKQIVVHEAPAASRRVKVELDWPGGTVSFYKVSSGKAILLHTFKTNFKEPVYPGFWVWASGMASLCQK